MDTADQQRQIERLRNVAPMPTRSRTEDLIRQHRALADDRLAAAVAKQGQSSKPTNYTAIVKDTDLEKGTVILELPNGGRFEARAISPTALIPGQVVPLATLPRGQQIGVVDAPPVCR